jgi:hypothetical protein
LLPLLSGPVISQSLKPVFLLLRAPSFRQGCAMLVKVSAEGEVSDHSFRQVFFSAFHALPGVFSLLQVFMSEISFCQWVAGG